jgi:hypothetical protein
VKRGWDSNNFYRLDQENAEGGIAVVLTLLAVRLKPDSQRKGAEHAEVIFTPRIVLCDVCVEALAAFSCH